MLVNCIIGKAFFLFQSFLPIFKVFYVLQRNANCCTDALSPSSYKFLLTVNIDVR